MTTTTKTAKAPKTLEWKWNRSIGRDALKLPTKGYCVDAIGSVWKDGDAIGSVTPLPNTVKVTPLEWVVTHEPKQETIIYKKLHGSYAFKSSSPRRKESPDGMRGPSNMIGSEPNKAVFVADEYEVTVTYTATKAVNQFGEVIEGKPKFPCATTLAYETGYGEITEYTAADLAVLDLPTEKVEKVYTPQREHFYTEAIKVIEKYLEDLDKPVEGLLKVGDIINHPVHGQGTVTKAFGTKNPVYQSVCADFPCGNKMIGKCDLVD